MVLECQCFQYNLLPFTDTNSVICKIIVGAVSDRPRAINNRPYKTFVKKEIDIYESHRYCTPC